MGKIKKNLAFEIYRSFGLVVGKIPVGKPCPFIDNCSYKDSNCPQKGNLKPYPHSCSLCRSLCIGKYNEEKKNEN